MNPTKQIIQFIAFVSLVLFGIQACKTKHDIFIVVGENANKTEQATALHLKTDLEKALKSIITCWEKISFQYIADTS